VYRGARVLEFDLVLYLYYEWIQSMDRTGQPLGVITDKVINFDAVDVLEIILDRIEGFHGNVDALELPLN
jgi:hypothetical protein